MTASPAGLGRDAVSTWDVGATGGPGSSARRWGLPAEPGVGVWRPRQDPRLPDAKAWSAMLAQVLQQVLDGRRPTNQLDVWVDERVLAGIIRERRLRARRGTRSAAVPPPTLRSVHVQLVTSQAAEVCAHLAVGQRPVVMAFRLQGRCDRWLCTALEMGPRG